MSANPVIEIARPTLILSDYHGGETYSSSSALTLVGDSMVGVVGSGKPTTPLGVSLSMPNLLALLDTDPATGRPPIFSLPLARLPVIPDGGLSAVFTFGARPPLLTEAIDGSVPVVFVANAQQGGVRIDVAEATRLRMTSPLAVQIDLPAGATIGETRLDAAGFAWLDLSFLSLISRVTEGASGLSTVMGFSEGSADFFIDFGDVPVSVAGASVGRLSASVMLDKAPNYAPFLS